MKDGEPIHKSFLICRACELEIEEDFDEVDRALVRMNAHILAEHQIRRERRDYVVTLQRVAEERNA